MANIAHGTAIPPIQNAGNAKTDCGRFCRELLVLVKDNPGLGDKTNAYLSSFANKQRSCEHPEMLHEKPLHSRKVVVWCGVSSFGSIGHKCFYANRRNAVPVPQTHSFNKRGPIFNYAPQNIFPGPLIYKNKDIAWPPTSPKFSACDCFLWNNFKFAIFLYYPPHTLQEVKNRIPVPVLQYVMSNFRKRLGMCVMSFQVMDILYRGMCVQGV